MVQRSPKGEIGHFEQIPLPGGRGILFTVSTGSSFDSARDSVRIAVLDLRSHRYQLLENAGTGPKYVPTGYLTYHCGGTLFADPFDVARLRVTGAEATILDGLAWGLLTGAVPDGRTLVYYQFVQSNGVIFLLPIGTYGKAGQPYRFHPEETSSQVQPVVSPDGKWLAHSSDHSGRFEVYMSPFQGSGGRYQVSTQGGRLPTWSRNGRELFYVELNPRRLMAADISLGKLFQVGVPKPLFVIRNDGGAVYYDVGPDGMRFLTLTQPQGASGASFLLVTDWFEELGRRTQLKN